MQYIVLDLEWNQPWPGSPSSKKVLPVPIHGEIIQIGAVRMDAAQAVLDEFQILIRPKYYRRLNSRVSKLTGLKDAKLREEGVGFAEAAAKFRDWCGEDCIFLTWGFDDINILQENILLHGMDPQWVGRWYNAQMMFNAQTGSGNAQKALKTAMEMFNIEATRPAHDALADAYHTALICEKLDLARGMQEYGTSLKSHEDGFHGAEIPGCISRKVYHGYGDKRQAIGDMGGRENLCPECGAPMQSGKWFSQPGRRYMTMAKCPVHGEYLLRIRLAPEEDGTLRVSRLIYEGASEAAESYQKAAEMRKKSRRHHDKPKDTNKTK